MSGYSWTPLDFVNNSAGATAQLQSRVFDPYNLLEITCFIPGYSAGSVFRLQFNGDTGTTAYSNAVMEGNTAPTTQTSGTSAGWPAANVTTGVARAITVFRIQNFNGQSKGGVWTGNSNTIVAGTAPIIVQGAGVWANNAQIIRVTMDVGAVGGTMNAGTQMWIMGMNGL